MKKDWRDVAVILLVMEHADIDDRNPDRVAALTGMDKERCKSLIFGLTDKGFLLNPLPSYFTVGFRQIPAGLSKIMKEIGPVVKTMIR